MATSNQTRARTSVESSNVTPADIQLNIDGQVFTVQIERSARLKNSARWTINQRLIVLRVPQTMDRAQVNKILADIQSRIGKRKDYLDRRTDNELEARAAAMNTHYFGGTLKWRSIRWVTNMQQRLGSCTTGGLQDGEIRISTRLKEWPDYVLDYVIAHEICHRAHPDHSPAFWELLSHFPQTEKALGFIEGVGFAENLQLGLE